VLLYLDVKIVNAFHRNADYCNFLLLLLLFLFLILLFLLFPLPLFLFLLLLLLRWYCSPMRTFAPLMDFSQSALFFDLSSRLLTLHY
jgi:hypothetical protein